MTIAVGQKLVYVPRDQRWRKPEEITVEKVGRKWAYFKHGRFDVDTLLVDGGQYSSPGRCYGSWSEYEESTERARLFVKFRRGLYGPVEGVTADDVREAARLLRIDLSGEG